MLYMHQLLKQVEKVTSKGGEIFYNVLDLEKTIQVQKMLLEESRIFLPFYICDGKMYELYAYELEIEFSKESTFEAELLRKTGEKNISEIDPEILKLRKKCYMWKEIYNEADVTQDMLEYFAFILHDPKLIEDVSSVYGKYKMENVYVSIY